MKSTIGIMPQEKIRERMYTIARGEYKPAPGDPKVWFTSQESMAEVLNDDSSALRHAIMPKLAE